MQEEIQKLTNNVELLERRIRALELGGLLPVHPRKITQAGLPDASLREWRDRIIMVDKTAGDVVPAYSDGTDWINIVDGTTL